MSGSSLAEVKHSVFDLEKDDEDLEQQQSAAVLSEHTETETETDTDIDQLPFPQLQSHWRAHSRNPFVEVLRDPRTHQLFVVPVKRAIAKVNRHRKCCCLVLLLLMLLGVFLWAALSYVDA